MKINKCIKRILPSILLFGIGGCTMGSTDNHSYANVFRYINESGVEIAIVGELNEYVKMPDSLVLPIGDSYEYTIHIPALLEAPYYFPYKLGGSHDNPPIKDYIPIKIYYNKDVKMSYIIPDKGKNPTTYWDENSYTQKTEEIKEKKHYKTITTYTYIFTVEDYQNALKAQK